MVQRLTSVSANILEALRLEGTPALCREIVDLALLSRRLVDDFATFARERQQSLAFEAAGDCRVLADPQKVELVLVNLLQNAIKFTPDGGHVRVCVAASADGVQLVVEDDGIGIEAAEQERVFEAFYTASDVWQHSSGTGSFSHLARGPGLGLAIARGYVEALGGRIRVESAGPGRGSRFVVVWPGVSAPPAL
jgi:signal transduction histidine kinase